MSKARRLYELINRVEDKIHAEQEYLHDLYSALSFNKYIEFKKLDLEKDLDEFCERYPDIGYEIYQIPERFVNTWLISVNYDIELTDDAYDELDKIKEKYSNRDIFLFTQNHKLF